MSVFQSFLTVSARGIALQLFVPVGAAAILYLVGLPLPAFIVFQFFIEGFALWQLAIGIILFTPSAGVSKDWFVFNMIFAMLYRLTTNGYQIYFYLQHHEFMAMDELLWLIPIHLYASGGVVYCFYVNGRLIRKQEEKIGRAVFTVQQNFLRLFVAFQW